MSSLALRRELIIGLALLTRSFGSISITVHLDLNSGRWPSIINVLELALAMAVDDVVEVDVMVWPIYLPAGMQIDQALSPFTEVQSGRASEQYLLSLSIS